MFSLGNTMWKKHQKKDFHLTHFLLQLYSAWCCLKCKNLRSVYAAGRSFRTLYTTVWFRWWETQVIKSMQYIPQVPAGVLLDFWPCFILLCSCLSLYQVGAAYSLMITPRLTQHSSAPRSIIKETIRHHQLIAQNQFIVLFFSLAFICQLETKWGWKLKTVPIFPQASKHLKEVIYTCILQIGGWGCYVSSIAIAWKMIKLFLE